ncbi:AMP-binding protein [Streptomyces luteolus]|uniref:AMP-binding protein n=1 Tax=Streptomyces luteolus TaxID=3043615 RepID=A0ABT6T1X1_9ACTN|nr:AMP-binding protein [Streptomyces sp. B-S-A12]MDI3421610.1 AMP-binding protein [Streptomyces sp. B-S-A12]
MVRAFSPTYAAALGLLEESRMERHEGWLLTDLFRALGRPGRDAASPAGAAPGSPLDHLLVACEVLMSDVGEASLRAVAGRALAAYAELDDHDKRTFFTHVTRTYDVDADQVRAAFHRWDDARNSGARGERELVRLFDVVEPARQQLLRRMNHAPDATLALVGMRADLRALMPDQPELRALDHDFHHLLTSWFNRGFLRMAEVTWDAPAELHDHLVRGEKVHPMAGRDELRRRVRPADRRVYAFFHPATGDVPLIFVEVALVRGMPDRIAPLLDPGPALDPREADTAALYSINNALDGLAGVSFGSFLIKQVIEDVGEQLPHLTRFATLSPVPGFRSWLGEQRADAELHALSEELATVERLADLSTADLDRVRPRLLPAVARYVTVERRADGRPMDPVARFHLGNGAAAWQIDWPANHSAEAWEQSYGVMINYRYEPAELERRHEDYVRRRTVAVGGPLRDVLPDAATAATATATQANRGPIINATDTGGTAPAEASSADPSAADASTALSTTALSTTALSTTAEKENEKGTPPMSSVPTPAPFTAIHRSFAEQARLRPGKVLFEQPDGRCLTYRETEETVRRVAARLVADGVTPGDRVAMQVEKSPEAVALYLATLRVGGVFLPLNTAYTDTETAYFIGDARPRVLVRSPERAAGGDLGALDGMVVETLGVSGEGTLLDGDDRHEAVFDASPDDPAAILYTSGTTGRSKGAVLSHGNLASNCSALLDSWQFTADDKLIHALPIFHIHGLFVAANMTLAAGASMYFLPKFDADAIVGLLPRATVLMGVPTFYTRLLQHHGLTAEACASMRLFVSGSAPLLAADHQAFEARTGHAILERYGMTETGMNTSNPYEGGPRKPGTVGTPLPGTEIRVVDEKTGEALPDGEVGSIEVRGPNVFTGYWQMPEKTASEFRTDGFFITGDLGRIDEDGYLCIVGRGKDLVISGGYNIYPKEVEELLDAHPDVLESAVIGVPHPDFGETVVAVVVPAPGARPQADELLAFIAGDLARFKHPRAVRVVEALPRNVMGKVQKAELRRRYAELFIDAEA